MLQKDMLARLIEDYLEKSELFLVDITISRDNDVEITIDSFGSVTIDHCTDISRIIEAGVNRDEEDFSLTVGSAGLSQPLKVLKQFKKFTGSEVEIILKKGNKFKAVIVSSSEEGIEVEYEKSIAVEGRKKREKVITREFYDYPLLKSVKPIINFR